MDLLASLTRADSIALWAVLLIAAPVLGGWLVPAIATVLPQSGWFLMKANTAVALLLCTAGLSLTRGKLVSGGVRAARICAGLVIVLAGAALAQHLAGLDLGIGSMLASDPTGRPPGLMSLQTAIFLSLLALSLMIEPSRHDWLGTLFDLLVVVMTILAVLLAAALMAGATALYGQAPTVRVAPQTLVCLCLLTLVQAGRRASHGSLAVLVGIGIGSRFARTALPLSLAMAFACVLTGAALFGKGHLGLPYAAALTAATLSVLLLGVVVIAGNKINAMERALRDMSLTDELTGLHNRRGFNLIGAQALLEARRKGSPLTVVYIDADGLKSVNDRLGHDMGSALLCEIATLLRTTFRQSDVVGRIGGDEFAVLTHETEPDLAQVLERLSQAVQVANSQQNRPYQISFSLGCASATSDGDETFLTLVDRADSRMYEDKINRRTARARASPGTHEAAHAQ